MANVVGIIIDPPTASRMRENIKWIGACENPAVKEAIMKIITPPNSSF